MKSLVVVSAVTFTLIFGVILATTGLLESAVNITLPRAPGLKSDEEIAADRIKANLDTERDRIQVASERMLTLRTAFDVEEKVLDGQQRKLQEMITELRSAQDEYSEERETSSARLAKVYGAMKPAKAAPILETLHPDVVLEIVSRMKDRQAAKVLAAMDRGLAAQISSRMSRKGENL
jgi:flagellar motility protein MotE (MotC chaperone)